MHTMQMKGSWGKNGRRSLPIADLLEICLPAGICSAVYHAYSRRVITSVFFIIQLFLVVLRNVGRFAGFCTIISSSVSSRPRAAAAACSSFPGRDQLPEGFQVVEHIFGADIGTRRFTILICIWTAKTIRCIPVIDAKIHCFYNIIQFREWSSHHFRSFR